MRARKFHETNPLPKDLSMLSKKQLIKRLKSQKDELRAFDEVYEALRLYKIQADYFREIATLFIPDINRVNPVIKSRYRESFERDELIKIPSIKTQPY